MYGVEFLREFDSQDQDHVARKNRLCELPSGPKLLPDAFDCILARVRYSSICASWALLTDFFLQSIKVKESTVFSRKYCTELTSLVCVPQWYIFTLCSRFVLQSTLSVFEVEIWCYRGGNTIPQWILREAGQSFYINLHFLYGPLHGRV
jgi:hypothetical protein